MIIQINLHDYWVIIAFEDTINQHHQQLIFYVLFGFLVYNLLLSVWSSTLYTSLMLKNPKCKAISPSWSLASICIYSGWVFSFILIGAICLQDFCLEMEKKNAANWASERHNSRWITPHKNKYLNERKFYT